MASLDAAKVDLSIGWGDAELLADFGIGSDILGRTEDMEPEPAAVVEDEEVRAGAGVEFVVVVERADCLVELAAAAPAPSLADEVRLTEFEWSSEWFTFWPFWAMMPTQQ